LMNQNAILFNISVSIVIKQSSAVQRKTSGDASKKWGGSVLCCSLAGYIQQRGRFPTQILTHPETQRTQRTWERKQSASGALPSRSKHGLPQRNSG